LMLLIHELGHAVAIRAAGLRAGYPVFIPGFGALIALKDQPRDPRVEAEIALAGPVAGGVAALSAAALYYVSHDRLFLALASTGFMLNLFNMIPLSPLDGGRVANLFSRRAWIAGLAMVAAMFVMTQAPMLLIIGLFALRGLWRRRAWQPAAEADDASAATAADRRAMATRYFGLCAFLAFGFYFANRLLSA
jgi:Zn-dependent protease